MPLHAGMEIIRGKSANSLSMYGRSFDIKCPPAFYILREIPMPRMNILNSLEQEAFECPPLFNHVERLNFFFAPLMFSDFMEAMRTPTNKVCFIVAAGYFKARRKFFARQFHQADI